MTLLYRTAEWHAFAKLRLHTESTLLLKRRTGTDVGYTEDGRDGRIGATRYAGGNGTRKEAEKRNV